MIDLRSVNKEELESMVVELGFPKFRADQVMKWIFKGKNSFRDMTNVPDSLKLSLEKIAYIEHLELVRMQVSEIDGTKKALFRLSDGNMIESVFMKYKFGNTICVSSQAGCRMSCVFCASGKLGLARNLTPGEMISQILDMENATGEKINHIVMMGTGEPFDNYENMAKFIRLANAKDGLGIGMRNITVSTCGIVPRIKDFAEEFNQVNLAISLHAFDNDARSSIMPINKKYPLEELVRACKDYNRMTGRRITFEYTLIKDVNDDIKAAKKLVSLLKGVHCHINLIPLNRVVESDLDTISRDRAKEFADSIESMGIPATVRRELGSDIDGACGQLRLSKNIN